MSTDERLANHVGQPFELNRSLPLPLLQLKLTLDPSALILLPNIKVNDVALFQG